MTFEQIMSDEPTTLRKIQRGFAENKLTSSQLVNFYFDRIQTLNPLLRSVVEVNPDARDQADEADQERARFGTSGDLSSLHGIPVLLKDTIATKDKLNTTAGSYALLGSVVPRDAGVVERLRRAGAVILGTASLTEWYSFRSLGRIPNGCGSAISVAANMVAVSLGSETHGSLLCPADHNSAVGLKPTVGLASRAGIVPILPRHDTIGPISRTVSDAVYVLDVIVGFDPQDYEATKEAAKFIPVGGYKQFLDPNGLRGKRLGVVRNPILGFLNGSSVIQDFERHLNTMRERGATVVDSRMIENVDIILDPKRSGELTAMLAEFKVSLNDYLKEHISSPARSLSDIIAFNKNNPELATFIASDKTSGFGEKERQAIVLMQNLSRDGFEKLMMDNELDAMVIPCTGSIAMLAIGGHPGITVPAGYDGDGMPLGICFGGLKGFEPRLIEIAYDFEQATMVRRPPLSKSFDMNRE
ncbi:hypothetical protein CIPAW_05G078300, partial [Carya illinoinensis]